MTRLILSALAALALTFAATPVARITSPGSFRLSGQAVPASSVPNWPLVAGDSVALGDKPGRITFKDGSVVYLTPASKADITVVNGHTVVRLNQGAVAYRFTKDSSVNLAGGKLQPISSSSKEGKMLVNGADTLWNPLEPEFYLYGRGSDSPERRAQQADVISMDPDNYNLDSIDAYRGYEPDWGTPAGEGGTGTIPPPAATEPGQDNPASPYK